MHWSVSTAPNTAPVKSSVQQQIDVSSLARLEQR
jgi:hypothetical protein